MYLLTALLLLIAVAFLPSPCKAVLQLTENNYETLTDGKTVFIKCFAPWVCQVRLLYLVNYVEREIVLLYIRTESLTS